MTLNIWPGPIRPARLPVLLSVVALVAAGALTACSDEPTASKQAAPAAGSTAAANDPVVARVGGAEIRESQIGLAEDDLGSELQGTPEQKREQVIAYLGDVTIVAQAGEKANIAESEEFKRRLALLRSKLLMGMQLQAVGKAGVTDAAMREVYDDAVKSMSSEEEVRARHILVATEEEATAIVTQLRGGADFAALAKEKSKDPGAADGGDLGFFTKDQMVKEFSEVAFRMYEGQISNPVKSQFGWHVIKLEEKRTKKPPPFDQVKEQIEAFVTRKAQTDYVAKLREANKVERLDKPADAPAAAPAATPAPPPAATPDPAKK